MHNMLNVLIELDKYGMNQTELAEKLGVDRNTVGNWWGGTSPTRKNRFNLNRLLDELKAKEKAIAERKPPTQRPVHIAIDRMENKPDWMDWDTWRMCMDCYWSQRWDMNYFKNNNHLRPLEELKRWETSKLWENENLMIALVANFHPDETLREHFSMLNST